MNNAEIIPTITMIGTNIRRKDRCRRIRVLLLWAWPTFVVLEAILGPLLLETELPGARFGMDDTSTMIKAL